MGQRHFNQDCDLLLVNTNGSSCRKANGQWTLRNLHDIKCTFAAKFLKTIRNIAEPIPQKVLIALLTNFMISSGETVNEDRAFVLISFN